jgi:NAD-dependent dihydropyrimidine dehydrogenase PreA subunit
MIKKSTINFWKMQGEGAWGIQRLLNMIHGYLFYTIYDHYITFIAITLRIMKKLPRVIYKAVVVDFYSTHYHSKIVTYENVKKLIALDEEVVLPTEESKKIIPWEIANKIILKNMDHLAIVDCPCRIEKKTAGKNYCEPINTCIFFGKVGVDFVTTHMPRMHGRRVTKEVVLDLLEKQQKNGKVLSIWFKDSTGYRAGVICCCCSCCCSAMEAELIGRKKGIQGLKHMAPSGYSIVVNAEKCNVCGKCVKLCHYDAMDIDEIEGKKQVIYNKDLCMGCGVCVNVCPNGATSLSVDPSKGIIFDVDSMVEKYGKQHQAIM